MLSAGVMFSMCCLAKSISSNQEESPVLYSNFPSCSTMLFCVDHSTTMLWSSCSICMPPSWRIKPVNQMSSVKLAAVESWTTSSRSLNVDGPKGTRMAPGQYLSVS